MGYTLSMRVEKTDQYGDWIDGLKDRTGRARILVRVDRLIGGNPGQHRVLTDGVSELKIDARSGLPRLLHATWAVAFVIANWRRQDVAAERRCHGNSTG